MSPGSASRHWTRCSGASRRCRARPSAEAVLRFDNRFLLELPGDPRADDCPRQVHGALWSAVLPTPVAAPRLLAHSPEVAAALGIDAATLASPEFVQVFAGNRLWPGMQPWASNYGGHQFGHWAGQLGDGRAISLGEALAADGARHELQLKGAGRTPYSRHADGRAVLRSSLREFVCSEAMHHLGVATTRALSLIVSGEEVVRDLFYDGHPRAEPGAIVCRVAPSFIRFGHFELPAARGDIGLLERLVEFTIARDFPHLSGPPEQRRGDWFVEVCMRTGRLLANWMRVGFVHGVMNTDNLSILGLTIDYGPYGWLEDFDPDWTPNTTDFEGRRYAYGRQPEIAQWNLSALAGALAPLFSDPAPLHAGLRAYAQTFMTEQARWTAARFGWERLDDERLRLARDFHALLQRCEIDLTLAFRLLADIDPEAPSLQTLEAAWYRPALVAAEAGEWQSWLGAYAGTLRADPRPRAQRQAAMNAVNPLYVPRNYLAQLCIDAAERGDLAPLHEWLETLRRPCEEQPGRAHHAARRPEWARERPGCSMLSCSS
ncbi:MAG: YdiU family protein [Xanthomonadales bacterium]|nr:YdiU family protein [Xanthomonadales bacterium]